MSIRTVSFGLCFVLMLFYGCSEPSIDDWSLDSISPSSISPSYEDKFSISGVFPMLFRRDVGCGGGAQQVYLDDEYDVYVHLTDVVDSDGDDTSWDYLCHAILDLEQQQVDCDIEQSVSSGLTPGSHYDVQVRSLDGSSKVLTRVLFVDSSVDTDGTDSEDIDTDTEGTDPDDTDSDDTDTEDTDTGDTDTVVSSDKEMLVAWTDVTPDFNGALEVLWSLEETLEQTVNCLDTQLGGDAVFDLTWNMDGLNVGVQVFDLNRTWVPNDGDDIRDYDSIEIFVDVPPLGGEYQGADNWFAVGSYAGRDMHRTDVTDVSAIIYSSADMADGYSLEIGIPWTVFDLTPASGMVFGFDLVVNDNDGEIRRCKQFWSNNETELGDTNGFGRIVLE